MVLSLKGLVVGQLVNKQGLLKADEIYRLENPAERDILSK